MTRKRPNRLLPAMLILSLSAVGGCAPADEPPTPEPSPVVAVNSVTAGEVSEGWLPLWDGKSFEGWRGFRMDGIPSGWEIENDAIHFAPPPEGSEEPRADLMTEAQYGDFELDLEWAVSPGGNSGIMFRSSEDQERSYVSAPEFQILDDSLHKDGQNPLTSAGSNYALQAPGPYPKRPPGEFNRAQIVVRGPHVEHWLNGEKVVEYELWSEEWRAAVAASKFAQWEAYGMNERGHIVLQDHGDEVWFRNIRIRELSN